MERIRIGVGDFLLLLLRPLKCLDYTSNYAQLPNYLSGRATFTSYLCSIIILVATQESRRGGPAVPRHVVLAASHGGPLGRGAPAPRRVGGGKPEVGAGAQRAAPTPWSRDAPRVPLRHLIITSCRGAIRPQGPSADVPTDDPPDLAPRVAPGSRRASHSGGSSTPFTARAARARARAGFYRGEGEGNARGGGEPRAGAPGARGPAPYNTTSSAPPRAWGVGLGGGSRPGPRSGASILHRDGAGSGPPTQG